MTEFDKRYREHKAQIMFHSKGSTTNMFQITLEEWTQLWIDSGKWLERGRKSHEYSLSRIDYSKPLTKDNARVMTNRERVSRVHKGKVISDEVKNKMSIASLGKLKSEEHKRNMSVAAKEWHSQKGHSVRDK